MALRQNLYITWGFHIYWQMQMVLHSQLQWGSSTLLEPAQFVLHKPNGKDSALSLWWWWWSWWWRCCKQNKQFLHLSIHQKVLEQSLCRRHWYQKKLSQFYLISATGIWTWSAFPLQHKTELNWGERGEALSRHCSGVSFAIGMKWE